MRSCLCYLNFERDEGLWVALAMRRGGMRIELALRQPHPAIRWFAAFLDWSSSGEVLAKCISAEWRSTIPARLAELPKPGPAPNDGRIR